MPTQEEKNVVLAAAQNTQSRAGASSTVASPSASASQSATTPVYTKQNVLAAAQTATNNRINPKYDPASVKTAYINYYDDYLKQSGRSRSTNHGTSFTAYGIKDYANKELGFAKTQITRYQSQIAKLEEQRKAALAPWNRRSGQYKELDEQIKALQTQLNDAQLDYDIASSYITMADDYSAGEAARSKAKSAGLDGLEWYDDTKTKYAAVTQELTELQKQSRSVKGSFSGVDIDALAAGDAAAKSALDSNMQGKADLSARITALAKEKAELEKQLRYASRYRYDDVVTSAANVAQGKATYEQRHQDWTQEQTAHNKEYYGIGESEDERAERSRYAYDVSVAALLGLPEPNRADYNFSDTPRMGVDATQSLYDIYKYDNSYQEPTDQWTQQQKNIYFTLLGDGHDTRQADEYAKNVNDAYQNAANEIKAQKYADAATSDFKHGLGMSIAAAGAGLLSGFEYLTDVQENAARGTITEKNFGVSDYSQAVTGSISNYLNNRYGTLGDNAGIFSGKGVGDAYQVAQSILQSWEAMAVGFAIGGVTGAAALGTITTNAMFFGNAAKTTLDEQLKKGIDPNKAVAYAALSGIAEVMGETFSIENLKYFKTGQIKSFMQGVARQAFIEGSEEGFTTLLNTFSDNLVNGSDSDYYAAMASYISQGMSYGDAANAAFKDWAKGIAWDTLGGALSGGISGGVIGPMLSNTTQAAKDQLTQYGGTEDNLIAKGTSLDIAYAKALEQKYGIKAQQDRAEARKAAQEKGGVAGAVGKIANRERHISVAQATKLNNKISETLSSQNETKTKTAITNELKNRGVTQNLGDLNEAVYKSAMDEKLTKAEQTALDGSEQAQAIRDELKQQMRDGVDLNSEDAPRWLKNAGLTDINKELVKANYGVDLDALDTEAKRTSAERDVSVKIGKVEGKLSGMEMVDGKPMFSVTDSEGNKKNVSLRDALTKGNLSEGVQQLAYLAAGQGEYASEIFNLYQNGQTINEYVAAMDTAINTVAPNVATREAMDKAKGLEGLTRAQKDYAWKVGQETKTKRKEAAKAKQDGRKKTEHKKGYVKFSGAKTALGDDYYHPTSRSKVKEADLRVIEKLAEVTGVNFVFYETRKDSSGNYVGANGVYKNGTVYLDVNAGLDRTHTQNAILLTAAHELTHHIAENAPEQYQALQDFVTDVLIKDGHDFSALVNSRMSQQNISRELAIEEVTADACEMVLGNSKAVETMAKEQPSLFQSIADWLKGFFENIKAAFTGVEAQHTESKAMVKYMDELTKLWDAGLVETTKAEFDASEYADKFSKKDFDDAVDKYAMYEGDKPFPRQNVVVGKTPTNIIDLGFVQLPMLISAKHIYLMANSEGIFTGEDDHYHNLGADTIKHLPEMIAHPVITYQQEGNPQKITMIADTKDSEGHHIMVHIEYAGNRDYGGARILANPISSAYGKPAAAIINEIERAMKDARVLQADKKRSQESPSAFWSQCPEGLWSSDFTKNIAQFQQSVKRFVPKEKQIKKAWNYALGKLSKEKNSTVKYSYGGRNSQSADNSILQQAKDMELQGVSDEQIRQKTGWFRGYDKKWRYEIDDSKMQFDATGNMRHAKSKQTYIKEYNKAFKELSAAINAMEDSGSLRDDLSQYIKARRNDVYDDSTEKLDNKLMAALGEKFDKFATYLEGTIETAAAPDEGGYLPDYIDHEELFKAYPELRNAEVQITKMQGNRNGSYSLGYDGKTAFIQLNEDLLNKPNEMKKTLIHEIQHAIQGYESHARGANVSYWDRQIKSGYDTRRQAVKQKYQELREYFDNLKETQPEYYKDMMELEAQTPDMPRGKILDWETLEQEPDPPEWEAFDAKRDALEEKYGDEIFNFMDKYYDFQKAQNAAGRTATELYYDTAGEIEARDTANRVNMTAEERKAKRPDIDNPDAVVRFSMREPVEQTDRYETAGVHWGYNTGAFTKADASFIWKTIADVQKLGYNGYARTKNGEIIADKGNKIFFIIPNFEKPVVTKFAVLDDTNETRMAQAKEWLRDASTARGYDTARETIENYYGETYFTGYSREDFQTDARKERGGEGKNRSGDSSQNREGRNPLRYHFEDNPDGSVEVTKYSTRETERLTADGRTMYSQRGEAAPLTAQEAREQEKAITALKAETASLQRRLEHWKNETKRTKVQTVRREDANRYLNTLLKSPEYSDIKLNQETRQHLQQALYDLGNYLVQGSSETLDSHEMWIRAQEIAEEMLSYGQTLADSGYDQQERRDIINQIKGYKFYLDQQYAGDVNGVKDFRKQYFGRLDISTKMLTGKGEMRTGVDQAYAELSQAYPNLFPEEIINPADQLLRMADALDELQDQYINPYEQYWGEHVAYLANTIVDYVLSGQLRQTAKTYADKAEEKLGKQKAKDRQKLDTLRQQKNDRIAEIKRQAQAAKAAAVDAERAAKWDKVQALKDYYTNREKQAMERRRETAATKKYRDRVIASVDTLQKWLIKNTDKEHVPEQLKAPLITLLDSLDMRSKRQLKGGQATQNYRRFVRQMGKLQKVLANQQKCQDNPGEGDGISGVFIDLPAGFSDELRDYVTSVEEILDGDLDVDLTTPIGAMNSDQLRDLSHILTTLTKAIQSINQYKTESHFACVQEASKSSTAEMKQLGETQSKGTMADAAAKFMMWSNGVPVYVFKRFGQAGSERFLQVQKGWGKMAMNVKKTMEFVDKAYTSKEVNEWEAHTRKVTLESGETVTLSDSQMMGIYCLAKREQGLKHILVGGIRVGDIETKGKLGGKKTLKQTIPVHVTQADLATIGGMLSDRQIEVAQSLQEFMNTQCAEWGNEISMERFGYRQFTEENYYPLNINPNNKMVEDVEEHGNSLMRLLNMSFTKALNPNANNSVVVNSIFDVFANHAADMAKYNALALPILDMLKWYNYKDTSYQDGMDSEGNATIQRTTNSVMEAMEYAYGNDAKEYFLNFVKDLNGTREGGRGEGGLKGIMGHFKAAAVGANLRVAIQQPTSIARAAYMIDPKYLTQGALMKGGIDEALKYSGIAVWKDLGYFDTNIQRGMRDQIKHNETWQDNLTEKAMTLAEKGDKATWGTIWNACKLEVQEKQHLQGDALMKATQERFDEIIIHTQVMDSTITRSDIMRNNSAMIRDLTSFMSEPTLSYNMMMDGFSDYRMAQRAGRYQGMVDARHRLAKGVLVFAINSALTSAAAAIVDAFRDDDDYETWAQKWQEHVIENMKDNVNPIKLLPLLSDAYELMIDGSDPQSTLWQPIKQFKKAADIAWEMIGLATGRVKDATKTTSYGRMTTWGAVYNVLLPFSSISGLPVSSFMRDAVAVYNTVGAPITGTKFKRYSGTVEGSVKTSLQSGYISQDKAIDLLMQNGDYTDANDAFWKTEEWLNADDDSWTKYNDLNAAIMANDKTAFEDAADELESHGITSEAIRAQVRKQIGEWFTAEKQQISKTNAEAALKTFAEMSDREVRLQMLEWQCVLTTGYKVNELQEAYVSGNLKQYDTVRYLTKYADETQRDAEEKVLQWKMEKDTGIKYSKLSQSYIYNEVSESQALNWLQKYGGLGLEEAQDKLRAWQLAKDYGLTLGSSTNGIKKALVDEDIMFDMAVELYMTYGGNTREEAEDYAYQALFTKETGGYKWSEVQEAYNDGVLSDSELQYWYEVASPNTHGSEETALIYVQIAQWKKYVPGADTINATAISKWDKFEGRLKSLGLDKEDFTLAWDIKSRQKSQYDDKGNKIVDAAQAGIEAIGKLEGYTREQKSMLARAIYSKSQINKYRNW